VTPETIDRLKAQLLTSNLSRQNQALFQIINTLIDGVRAALFDIQTVSGGGGGGGGGILGQSFITVNPDTGTLPNSSQILAGQGINILKQPNRIVISSAIPMGGDGGGEEGGEGPPGPQGPAGPSGPAGPTGSSGLSVFYAYDGEDGEDGLPGLPGPQGFTGSAGATGAAGSPGIPGIDGLDGERGEDSFIPGPIGLTGATGATGATGPQGIMGPPGYDAEEPLEPLMIPGPQGIQGPAGGGGGGGLTFTDFTKDLGAAERSGTFDITGLSGLTPDKNVLIVQTMQPISSKGDARDEFELQPIILTGYVVDANTIRALWNCDSVCAGDYAFAYAVSG
jgi:hypothetical protein